MRLLFMLTGVRPRTGGWNPPPTYLVAQYFRSTGFQFVIVTGLYTSLGSPPV
jgi:hypothetical protein